MSFGCSLHRQTGPTATKSFTETDVRTNLLDSVIVIIINATKPCLATIGGPRPTGAGKDKKKKAELGGQLRV